MARTRPTSDLDREQALRVYETLGGTTSARVLGVRQSRLNAWVGGKGKISPSEKRRLNKVADSRMVDFLGRLQRKSRDRKQWEDRKGRKRVRTEKQIDAALRDMVDASHVGKQKRSKIARRDIPSVMDRLGIPVTGPDAEYLDRRARRAA